VGWERAACGQLRAHPLIRQRERDLGSAREVAVTGAFVDLGTERLQKTEGHQGLAEAPASGTISSMGSPIRSGLCADASFRSRAPILNPFVQTIPVLPSCAPSAIQARSEFFVDPVDLPVLRSPTNQPDKCSVAGY